MEKFAGSKESCNSWDAQRYYTVCIFFKL